MRLLYHSKLFLSLVTLLGSLYASDKQQEDLRRQFGFPSSYSFITEYPEEYITDFDSTITVEKDGLLSITEQITVIAAQKRIKRGIERLLLHRYPRLWGMGSMNTHLAVRAVLKDGKPEPYTLVSHDKGTIIRIGSPEIFVSGKHTYVIEYALDRHIASFTEGKKTWTELYFNITGNETPFFIQQARAEIILPSDIPSTDIRYQAYTGRWGAQGAEYTVKQDKNRVLFKTTRPLKPGEGITIAVTWPPGYVAMPTMLQKIGYGLTDFAQAWWYILGLLFLIGYFSQTYRLAKALLKEKPIIPLFAPPQGFSPGEVRALYLKKDADPQAFAADIVDMAVNGYLSIDKKKGWWTDSYIFTKKEIDGSQLPGNMAQNERKKAYYDALTQRIFKYAPTVETAQENKGLREASVYAANYYRLNQKYLDAHGETILWGMIIALFVLFIPGLFVALFLPTPLFIACGLLVPIFIYFIKKLYLYTQEGLDLANHIQGFKMYLETAETERLDAISTPPERTPELYETFLPYAIALGAEKQWSQAFVPVFKRLESIGKPYKPMWYGGHFNAFNPVFFSQDLGSSLQTSFGSNVRISSAPGTYSGSSGRGSSGGGGGGGGVGGW